MKNITTVVIVDLDNLVPKSQERLFSLYTPNTLFVVGLLDQCQNRNRMKVLRDMFTFHKHQLQLVTLKKTIPDGIDVLLSDHIGKNMMQWKESGVENIILASDDTFVCNIALMLQHLFKVWIFGARVKQNKLIKSAKGVGVNLHTIMLKE